MGIDLGTTHTVLAYADLKAPRRARTPGEIQCLPIEQLVAPGAVAAKRLLPSMRYHPADGELAVATVIDVALALKALKRVADRAQNLAEYVIYIVEGQDIRHQI